MTDPSKRYWITEQGMKEAAQKISGWYADRSRPGVPEMTIKGIAEVIAVHSKPETKVPTQSATEWAQGVYALLRLGDNVRLPNTTVAVLSDAAQALIAAHSEAASLPELGDVLENFRVHLSQMIQNYRCLLHEFNRHGMGQQPQIDECDRAIEFLKAFEARQFEAAAPPQGTPAPEPDSCPTCGSGNRKRPLAVCPVHDSFAELCADPWHSTVAMQK